MKQLTREYNKRDILSKWALTRIGDIYEVLEAFKGKKMFRVDGSRTKAFDEALAPLMLNQITKNVKRGDANYRMQNISIRTSYSSLEIQFRCIINYDNNAGCEYFDIPISVCSFKNLGFNYDYNDILNFRDLHQLEQALEGYITEPLESIIAKKTQLEALEQQVKEQKDKMPYWSYR